jgi:hypothetical protein
MLLDVAIDLDAEAEAIEAEMVQAHHRRGRTSRALVSVTGADSELG